jgi:hypothetical protein
MLHTKSAEYWANVAPLDELHDAAMEIEVWTEEAAALLDFAYMERTARLIERTRAESKDQALALADHIARIAHDTQRDALDALERPYFARWRLLTEMLHRCADRLQLPELILGRKHVREILQAVARAGGRLAQGALDTLIRNEGQRSATLKIMETWDLVERVVGPGNTRVVVITDLGRLAIGATAAAASVAVAAPMIRFCEALSVPQA